MFKWWPWSDLDLFYGKVKFGNLGLFYGKKWKQWIFQKLLQPVIWKLVDADNYWVYEVMWVSKVKVISLPYIFQVLYVLCFTNVGQDIRWAFTGPLVLWFFIVVPWLYLGNSQVSVYRTIGPTLVIMPSCWISSSYRFHLSRLNGTQIPILCKFYLKFHHTWSMNAF